MARGRPKGYKMSDEHKAALLAGRSVENKTSFQIGRKWRVYSSDERNWTLQKANGTNDVGEINWVSQLFYSSLPELLRALSRRIVNKELKIQGHVEDFIELAKRIEEAESKVLDQLKQEVPDSILVEVEEVA
jgi:hypothetical protein